MAVFVTRNMLSKMNRVSYPTFTKLETVSLEGDHWQKLCAVVRAPHINSSPEGISLSVSRKRPQTHSSFDDFMCELCRSWTAGRLLRPETAGGLNDSSALSKTMICRVCGCDGYTPISEKTNGVYIVDALRSISNIMVELHDSLPKFICTSCLEKLKVAIEFKNMCQASDRKFKKILNPMGDPSLHTYPYSRHDFQLILKDIKAKRMEIEERKEKQRQLKEQMRIKSSVKGKHFVCSSCDMNFAKREQLVEHRREGKCMKRACDICGELVTGIRQHMRLIHKQRHCCTVCGKEFPVQARLKNHMLVHTNTFNFFCDLCPYKCKHKYYLVMHMRTHTGEKPYKCQQCPATFVNPSNLNKHKLTHQEKQFKCTLCEKTFRTNAALREHHDAAHMNIKHTCHYCGRDFCYRSDLRKHEIRSHNRTKRDYIGGEPTYKQVERMQKQQEVIPIEDTTKWRQEVIVQPQQIIQTYIDIEGSKNYATDATHQAIYFSDGNGILQQPLHMFQQQTVEITLPELMKKDDVKITYEPQQSIGYF